MPTLNVTATTDYSIAPNNALVNGQNITAVTFTGGPFFATFSSTQVGGSNLSSTTAFTGSSSDDIIVFAMAAAGSLSLVGFTFLNWTPGLRDDRVDIDGSTGNDSLRGAGVATFFTGGAGADTLIGGSGDDRFSYFTGDIASGESINGGGGVDTINLAGGSISNFTGVPIVGIERLDMGGPSTATFTGQQIGLASAGRIGTVRANGGVQTLIVNATEAATFVDLSGLQFIADPQIGGSLWNSAQDVITINGTGDADQLTGSSEADSINGASGNDTIVGGAGADRLDGGGGEDWVKFNTAGSAVIVNLFTGAGFGGDAQGDVYLAVENVAATNSADVVVGTALANSIEAFDGADTLYGNAGNDGFLAGGGDDLVFGHALGRRRRGHALW
jgi:Ca2+-binding RTX toxin-like protein